jgi:hypothetical protein
VLSGGGKSCSVAARLEWGEAKNGGGMSCGAGLPQSRAPFYRVRVVGGGRLLVMELQGAGGECPLMTLVLGEGMRGQHRLMEGKRWGFRDDSFSCGRDGQRPAQ